MDKANADPIITEGTEHHTQHDVTIRWKAHSHFLEFSVKRGTRQPDGSIVYMYFPEDAGMNEPTWEFAQGDRFVDGSIKWDGCAHLNFGDDNGYLHLCGGHDFAVIRFVLNQVFHLARQHVPHFDGEIAGITSLDGTGPSEGLPV